MSLIHRHQQVFKRIMELYVGSTRIDDKVKQDVINQIHSYIKTNPDFQKLFLPLPMVVCVTPESDDQLLVVDIQHGDDKYRFIMREHPFQMFSAQFEVIKL